MSFDEQPQPKEIAGLRGEIIDNAEIIWRLHSKGSSSVPTFKICMHYQLSSGNGRYSEFSSGGGHFSEFAASVITLPDVKPLIVGRGADDDESALVHLLQASGIVVGQLMRNPWDMPGINHYGFAGTPGYQTPSAGFFPEVIDEARKGGRSNEHPPSAFSNSSAQDPRSSGSTKRVDSIPRVGTPANDASQRARKHEAALSRPENPNIGTEKKRDPTDPQNPSTRNAENAAHSETKPSGNTTAYDHSASKSAKSGRENVPNPSSQQHPRDQSASRQPGQTSGSSSLDKKR